LREKSLANRVFATLDAALDAAREGLAAMASLPEALMRLAGRNWILDPL
jgi:hypothetical protein